MRKAGEDPDGAVAGRQSRKGWNVPFLQGPPVCASLIPSIAPSAPIFLLYQQNISFDQSP